MSVLFDFRYFMLKICPGKHNGRGPDLIRVLIDIEKLQVVPGIVTSSQDSP
jgi:hypothetical protein